MKDKIKIDLPIRTEERYIVHLDENFLDRISPYVERKIFSDNEYVQTIYFNNEEHVVPFEFSIKARRYLPNPPKSPVMDDSIFFLDLKRGSNKDKQKIRLKATLEEATKIINERYSFSEIPLRPYVLIEYLRQHYIPKNTRKIRITYDTNIKYFFFPKDQKEAVEIGRENDYARVEIKKEKPDKYFDNLIREILQETNAVPVISKKFTAYNLIGLYHVRTSGKPFHKELKGYEIEAKLEVDTEEIFQRIKQFFKDRNSEFRLPQHFPYTFESASINKYYRNSKGLFKAMFRGNEAEIVRKGNPEIIRDPFGLNCILKRKEKKGDVVPVNSRLIRSAQLQGELYRMRKAFWVENPQTRRFYHISLDCCLGLPGTLYQLEVEYTGRYKPEVGREEEIVEDIAKLTKTLIERFPELKPSQLTKQDWLGIE